MKWLLIQEEGHHEQNLFFRECYAWAYALEKCFQTYCIWGKGHENFSKTPDFESFDVIVCLEQYSFAWLPDFKKINGPVKVQWIVDLHCHHQYLEIAEGFNLALHATRSLMDGYHSKRNIWFPNAFDERMSWWDSMRKTDFLFVANINHDRAQWVEALKKDCGLEYHFALGRQMIEMVRGASIHFNKNVGCDINYRTFETIGLGTCLLTNSHPDLERLGLIDGVTCLTYRDIDECKQKYQDSIATESYRQIASNGKELSQRHTYTARIQNLLQIL